MILEYDVHDGKGITHITEEPFETKEELEEFLQASLDEIWIILSSVKIDGKLQKIILKEA